MNERGPLFAILAVLTLGAIRWYRNRPDTAARCRHGYPRGPWGSRGVWGSDHQTVDEWRECVALGKAGVALSEQSDKTT